MAELVPVSQCDLLDEDPPLRGQNYACVSFISPEDVIKKKEVFFMEMYLKNFSIDMNEFFTRLGEKYKDDIDTLMSIKEKHQQVFDPDMLYEDYLYYVNNNSANLDKDYYVQNNFQTSLRGLKIRGVFDSLKEAEIRAQVLKKIDNRFNVYVAQVGCWVPFSPNPDDIENQEYAETQLNTLMKNYKENQEKKDVFYEERKRELQVLKMKEKLAEKDAWMKKKEEAAATATATAAAVPEAAVLEDVEIATAVDAAVEDVIESVNKDVNALDSEEFAAVNITDSKE
jgi:hypothetical protein